MQLLKPIMTTTPLTEFHLFPQLPSELRLKIWSHDIAIPRIVTFRLEKEKADKKYFGKAFVPFNRPPTALGVCRESRFEALSIYKPSFETLYSPVYTYISFAHDTIRCKDELLQYIGKEQSGATQHIQRLVLEVRDVAYFAFFCMDVIKSMGGLTELELSTHQGEVYSWNRGGRYVETLHSDFNEAKMQDPGWECPDIAISHLTTGERLSGIKGGALIPGWKEGDEIPENIHILL